MSEVNEFLRLRISALEEELKRVQTELIEANEKHIKNIDVVLDPNYDLPLSNLYKKYGNE